MEFQCVWFGFCLLFFLFFPLQSLRFSNDFLLLLLVSVILSFIGLMIGIIIHVNDSYTLWLEFLFVASVAII